MVLYKNKGINCFEYFAPDFVIVWQTSPSSTGKYHFLWKQTRKFGTRITRVNGNIAGIIISNKYLLKNKHAWNGVTLISPA